MKDLEDLFTADQFAREIVDASPAALLLMDEFGRILFSNRRIEAIFGHGASDLKGKTIDQLIPDSFRRDHLAHSTCFGAQPVASQMGEGKILYGIRQDGTQVPVEISLHPIRTDNSVLLVAYVMDATCKQNLESARQKELLGAQQRMVESERLDAIGEMVTGLAHESRNALQRALSSLDLLELDLQARTEQMDLVQRIKHALTDLNGVYEEVRHYASPIMIRPQKVDLRQLCIDSFDELTEKTQADARWLRLDTAEPFTVSVDPVRMKQVMKQIFSNAIAASEVPADIRVDISEPSEGWVKLAISDAGSGIKEAEIRKAFAPFFTTKQHGTGLGLAICRRILGEHDGDIQLANNHRPGVTVTLTLPVAPETDPP